MKLNELHGVPPIEQLIALKPEIAAAAQKVYDLWDVEVGGICDQVADAIMGVVAEHFDVEMDLGGFDGDDHAWVVVRDGDTAVYGIDIPPSLYETGGGYNWRKIEGHVFSPNEVLIWAI